MNRSEARAFLAHGLDDRTESPSHPSRRETWADIGAGEGTFTRALASLLGADAAVYAVDKDATKMRTMQRLVDQQNGRFDSESASIQTLVADVAQAAEWGGNIDHLLDGIVIANTLHYIPYSQQQDTLAALARLLHSGGRLVVIEYEDRAPNPWVPYPIPFEVLAATLPTWFERVERRAVRRSAFGGAMYLAVGERERPYKRASVIKAIT